MGKFQSGAPEEALHGRVIDLCLQEHTLRWKGFQGAPGLSENIRVPEDSE